MEGNFQSGTVPALNTLSIRLEDALGAPRALHQLSPWMLPSIGADIRFRLSAGYLNLNQLTRHLSPSLS